MSSDLEDAVMDRRKKMSYMDITSREKREVFSLAVVKRAMRHLQFSKILMSEEVLQTARRFMEVGPNRGSILQIGYDSLQSCDINDIPERSYRDEKSYISPTLRIILDIIGHHPVTLFLAVICYLCDIAYTIFHIYEHGASLVSITALISTFLFSAVGVQIAIPELMAQKSNCAAWKWHIEEMYYSGFLYLQLKGLDVLASAQERMAKERNHKLDDGASLRLLKEKFLSGTMKEALTVHFMFGFIPMGGTMVMTMYRSLVHRGDLLVFVLATGTLWR